MGTRPEDTGYYLKLTFALADCLLRSVPLMNIICLVVHHSTLCCE